MKSPAFQVYVNDFLGSTKVGVMSTEEIGAYWLLLFLDWQEVGFVYDETSLSRWCRMTPSRFRRAWVALSPCFTERDGRLYNPRLEKERTKQAAWKDKSSKAGHLGAEKRWGKSSPNDNQPHNSAMAEAGVKHDIPLPSPVTTTTPQEIADRPGPKSPRSSKSRGALVMTEREVAFFAYYGSRHPRRGPPDDEQIRKVRKAQLSFSDEQMRQAVDGNLEDPWAVKTGKHEIGWIFRDHDHISQAIEHYHRANAPLVDDQGRLTADGQRVFGSAA